MRRGDGQCLEILLGLSVLLAFDTNHVVSVPAEYNTMAAEKAMDSDWHKKVVHYKSTCH